MMTPGAGVERRDSGSRGHRRRRRCRGGLLKKGAVAVVGTNGPRLALLLVLLAGTSPAASAQDVEELRILAPLYARPDGDFWSEMVAAAPNTTVNYSVVINPSSGPGDAVEDVYTTGINELLNAGVEVLCYVPTGFGQTDVADVTADVDTYESFYPDMCDGFFFDEGPGSYENTWKYTEYYTHVQQVSGAGSTVVVNPGIQPHISLYHIGDVYESANPSMGGQVVITSFENNFLQFYDGSQDYTNQEVPFPYRYLTDRYLHSIMVYGAYFTTLQEFLDDTVFKLYCSNWGYVFFTDDSFYDDGNPWDSLPGYFSQLLLSVERAQAKAGECGTLAPTGSPTPLPTLAPVAPGETRAPLPTPSPTVYTTAQPAAIGETRAPLIPAPTPAPTASPTTPAPTLAPTKMPTAAPTPAPTRAPTVAPTAMPTVAPTPEAGTEAGSGAGRGARPYSASVTAVLSGAVVLMTIIHIGA